DVTKAAVFVGERRWNLRTKDGLDIRLPEHDVGNALAELSRLDKEEKLFSRDIVAVDMRLPDRLVVQLSDDAAKAREKLYDDKKPKKKAGDACPVSIAPRPQRPVRCRSSARRWSPPSTSAPARSPA